MEFGSAPHELPRNEHQTHQDQTVWAILTADFTTPLLNLSFPVLEVAGKVMGFVLIVGLILAIANPRLLMLLWIGMGG